MLNKQALDQGFIDRCASKGITDMNRIQSLFKLAEAVMTEEEKKKKEQEKQEKKAFEMPGGLASAGIGALGGGALGAGIGGLMDGWQGAGIGAGIGALGGAGLGYGASQGVFGMLPGQIPEELKRFVEEFTAAMGRPPRDLQELQQWASGGQ